jgi:hypothetical protein
MIFKRIFVVALVVASLTHSTIYAQLIIDHAGARDVLLLSDLSE